MLGEIVAQEPLMFVFSIGDHWNPHNWRCKILPVLPVDLCFELGDEETLWGPTSLLRGGWWREWVRWNWWFKGPSMVTLRCLLAMANCRNFAYVAGRVMVSTNVEVLNSAEKNDQESKSEAEVTNFLKKHNPESRSWDPLPRMNLRRKLYSGYYMDKKFYVIGGVDENDKGLTCGEFYDT